MDIYSSGLTLLTLGLPAPRWVAAAIDGVLMILGAIYIVWISGSDFIYIFEGFLITLGVPMAAWCGVFLADLLLRRRDYDEAGALRRPRALRRRRVACGGLDGRRDRRRLGARRPAVRLEAASAGWATSSSPSDSAARPAPGRSPTSASRSPWPIGFVGYLLLGFLGVRRQERDSATAG